MKLQDRLNSNEVVSDYMRTFSWDDDTSILAPMLYGHTVFEHKDECNNYVYHTIIAIFEARPYKMGDYLVDWVDSVLMMLSENGKLTITMAKSIVVTAPLELQEQFKDTIFENAPSDSWFDDCTYKDM